MNKTIGSLLLSISLAVSLLTAPSVKVSAEEKTTEKPSVIAGTVSVAETLGALSYDKVVGVPETSYKLPEMYKDLPSIGKPMKPDAEIVRSLNPDLFISVSSLKDANEPALKQLGINTLFVDFDSPEKIKEGILLIGKETGTEKNAEKIVEEMDKDFKEARSISEEKIKSGKTPRVLFLFGSPKSIMVGTESTYVGSLIKELGVENVASLITEEDAKGFVPVNMEKVLTSDPDIIIRMTHVNPEESKKMMDKEFEASEIWSSMRAVRENKIVDLDPLFFSTSGGVNAGKSIMMLCESIFGK